jgi:hypothetical protein
MQRYQQDGRWTNHVAVQCFACKSNNVLTDDVSVFVCEKCSSLVRQERCGGCGKTFWIAGAGRKNRWRCSKCRRMNRTATVRQVKETQCQCQTCGHVWSYSKLDQMMQVSAAQQNCGKSMMCCSGCAPAAVIPDKQVVDLDRCPACGSRAVVKQNVVHYGM